MPVLSGVPQGKVIVQREEGYWLVLMPDDQVVSTKSRKLAERRARTWFAQHLHPGVIGIGTIEWRETETKGRAKGGRT
jgi:hypothetical protein